MTQLLIAVLMTFVPCAGAAPGPGVRSGEDDSAAELMRQREELRRQFEAVNAGNPFGGGGAPTAGTAPGAGMGAEGEMALTGPFAQLQTLLQSPVVQKLGRLATNPEFTQSADRLIAHPNRWILLGCQGALLLLMIGFREWRNSKVRHWAQKLWIRFYSFFLWAGLAVVVVPRLVLGEDYFKVLKAYYEALRS